MAAPQRTKRRYGLPWAGYQSSAAPHLVAPDKATSDGPSSSRRSQNLLYSPLEGKFYRRPGQSAVGSTSGILENGTGELTVARCRHLISMRSSSLSDGYPTRATLWTEEGNHKGCVHWFNSNGGFSDHTMGQEFGATQYPTTINTPSYMKAVPYIRTTDGTIGRFNTLTLRGIAAPGGRRLLEVSDRLHAPNLRGTPWYTNKQFNDNDADTGSVFRVGHTGSPSPLGLPALTTGLVNTAGSWHDADLYYVSVAYRMEDGSVTMPIIPRDRNDEVNYDPTGLGDMTGFGKVQIDGAGTTRYFYMTWSKIPIGPPGTVGRYLLRTPKKAEGVGSDPSPLDLRITAYIPNNTQTTYQDPNGNDLSLVTDPLLVRFDHIMQPPARYISTFDGRVLVGYTNPHPVAFYLAPDVNVQDTDTASLDNIKYEFTLNGGTLTLYKDAGTTTITNIGTRTIQQVVDLINNTAAGGGGGKWFAAVAPGADSAASCDNTATAAANGNLTSVTGATDYTGDTAGRIRSYGSSWAAPVFFSTTYLGQFPTQKRRIFFTMGGPGMPAGAANSWAAGNYRTAPESWGDYMGSAPLTNGAVLCFSKAIGVLQNRKGGSSGLDEDYRLYDLNLGRGCIAWDSIVEFNGAVGYLTTDGFVVTDGQVEVLISGDVWNPATQTGEWAYEIAECAKAAAADNDFARFHAKVMGGVLYVAFRLTGDARAAATDAHPNYRMEYDFTGSQQYSGIRGVLRPDGQPWGWSTPLTAARSYGPFGEVVTSSGVIRYTASEDASGQDSNGRIYNIKTGTTDEGSAFTSRRWTARDLADHLKKKSPQEVTKVYKKNGTGMTFKVYRDGLGTTADATITLPTTSTDNFKRLVMPLPMAARTPADSLEYLDEDDGSGSDAPQDWGFEVDLLLLDSYT